MANFQSICFRAGREHRANSQIIGAILLCHHRLLYRLGGDADHLVRPQLGPHIPGFHIALPNMHAIRIYCQGNLHIVIDDERNLIASAQFFDFFGFFQKMLLIQFLLP
ncbi:hypothetical protein SDC9_210026 [bioreactor metagenome]|uniref:Uncharacterized protein n=1 Tax=bioreactor metagenome TaxID=1076179 RepID=A0A645JHV7_9ZZZZ